MDGIRNDIFSFISCQIYYKNLKIHNFLLKFLDKKKPKNLSDEDEDLYINLEVVCFYVCKTKIYMLDSAQRPDSNRRPLFK